MVANRVRSGGYSGGPLLAIGPAMNVTTTALLATLLAGCGALSSSSSNCQDASSACGLTSLDFATNPSFPIVNQESLDFQGDDGLIYTLVRIDTGDPSWGNTCADCAYNTICSFVNNGADYPVAIDIETPEEAAFAPDLYGCDDTYSNCDLSGYDLEIVNDQSFYDWYDSTDDDLTDCIDGSYLADFRKAGHQPRATVVAPNSRTAH
jgi:hypothetical protein